MTMPDPPAPPSDSRLMRAAALAVHWLTAFGAGLALLALFEAVRAH